MVIKLLWHFRVTCCVKVHQPISTTSHPLRPYELLVFYLICSHCIRYVVIKLMMGFIRPKKSSYMGVLLNFSWNSRGLCRHMFRLHTVHRHIHLHTTGTFAQPLCSNKVWRKEKADILSPSINGFIQYQVPTSSLKEIWKKKHFK